ncbi:MAG: hypothetical protein M1541_16885 [Acidobacteria bacterium]|nr:hypothetical protein [Acidobacteriota bacterium]
MATSFTDLCVYTIKHSDDLVAGRSDTFHENRPWATARRLLVDAERRGESVAVVFAEAEKTDNLVAWAVLKDIQITPDGTDYTFANLRRFKKPLRPKTDLRKRNGEPLSQNFIRPYAICRRPKFIA